MGYRGISGRSKGYCQTVRVTSFGFRALQNEVRGWGVMVVRVPDDMLKIV